MKRWLWLGLLALLALGLVLVGNWRSVERFLPIQNQQPPEIPTIETFQTPETPQTKPSASTSGQPLLQPAINLPQVDPTRLLAHLDALNFERYDDRDRAQARTYLARVLRDNGWSPTVQPFSGGANLVAERSGTNPEAGAILVAAHYDTVQGSPGADDNASAVVSVLELSRLLRSRATPATLKLALFDLEEQGLQGSLAYTANAKNLTNLRGAVILEMLGYACHVSGCQHYPQGLPIKPPSDRGDFLAIVGDQDHLPLLTAFETATHTKLPPVFTLAVPLKGLMTPDLLRSDHAPFWYRNIGAVMVTDTANFRTPHYHQPSDTLATIDRSFLVGSAQIAINAVATLLENPTALKTIPPPTPS